MAKKRVRGSLLFPLLLLFSAALLAGCIGEKQDNAPEGQEKIITERNDLKELFLVSENDWKAALQLVPLAVWKENGKRYAHPVLFVPVRPSERFLANMAHFIKEFGVNRVTFIGEEDKFKAYASLLSAPELQHLPIQQVGGEGYLLYWKEYEGVVYVENSYETALLASSYASLLNAPLVIRNGELDRSATFEDKKVILVGSVSCPPKSAGCDEAYSLAQLQKKYRELTDTDKVILVHSGDITSKEMKVSLHASLLAAAKEEIIVSINAAEGEEGAADEEEIDAFLKKKLAFLGMESGYLTIMAHPDYIPMKKEVPIKAAEERGFESLMYEVELDSRYYGTLGENLIGTVDFAVGRIFGEGTPLYIARDIFFGQLPKSHERAMVIYLGSEQQAESEATKTGTFSSGTGTILWTKGMKKALQEEFPKLITFWGKNNEIPDAAAFSQVERSELYKRSSFIYYHGHGSEAGLASYPLYVKDLETLNYPFIVTTACSTCRTGKLKAAKDPFCARNLLEGAMGFVGTFDDGLNLGYVNSLITDMYINGLPMGEVIKNAKNLKQCDGQLPLDTCVYEGRAGDMRYLLMGDPALKAKWWE